MKKENVSYVVAFNGEYLQRFNDKAAAIEAAAKMAQRGYCGIAVIKETIVINLEDVVYF